jgi:peptidylprolyl isomerase
VRNLALNGLSISKWAAATLAAAFLALPLASCGSAGSTAEFDEPRTALSRTEVAQLPEAQIGVPEGPPPKRLIVKDLKKGSGRAARVTDELAVDFIGAPYAAKSARWRSRGGLEPFVFHLGAYDVVPGWEEGLEGMRVGGRRELIVPARLTGSGARVYVVDLLAIQRGQPPAYGAADAPEGWPDVNLTRGPATSLAVEDLHEGSGPVVRPPAEVVAKLYGVNHETGESFLNAWGPDRTVSLPLRDPHSVWTEGLRGMRLGGRRRLIVPAGRAFGDPAFGYLVELVAIG